MMTIVKFINSIEVKHWSQTEKQFIRNNAGKLTIAQLAANIGRTEDAIKLFLHRNRIVIGPTVQRNIVIELLKLRFKNPEDFTPSKAFYTETRLTAPRWWDLYFGRKPITENEYLALTAYFGITLQEAFDTRQLSFDFPTTSAGEGKRKKTKTM